MVLQFIFSGPIDYNVLPIVNSPLRLAIDLKNTHAKHMRQDINILNVNRVRGAYNTPSVYRLVFDLKYLKNHNITFKKNAMMVEFFDKVPFKTASKKAEKGKKAPAKQQTQASG